MFKNLCKYIVYSILLGLLLVYTTNKTLADTNDNHYLIIDNPAFGSYINALQLSASMSIRLKNLSYYSLGYQQRDRIFRLPGRATIEIGLQKATSEKKKPFNNTSYLGVMQEVVLGIPKIYSFTGLGIYIKNKVDAHIGSRFAFGIIAGLGTRIDVLKVELFMRHFSNGHLSLPNKGQNFIELRIGYLY